MIKENKFTSQKDVAILYHDTGVTGRTFDVRECWKMSLAIFKIMKRGQEGIFRGHKHKIIFINKHLNKHKHTHKQVLKRRNFLVVVFL